MSTSVWRLMKNQVSQLLKLVLKRVKKLASVKKNMITNKHEKIQIMPQNKTTIRKILLTKIRRPKMQKQ